MKHKTMWSLLVGVTLISPALARAQADVQKKLSVRRHVALTETSMDWFGLENLTSGLGASFQIVGDPAVINRTSTSLHAFGRSSTGHLIHYQWTGSSWLTPVDRTGASGLLIASDPVAVARGTSAIDVFALNSSGDLIQFAFSGTTWSGPFNLTSNVLHRMVGQPIAASPSATSLEVYGINAVGDLMRHAWNGSSWTSANITQVTGSQNATFRYASKIVFGRKSSVSIDIFGRNSNNNLVQFYSTSGTWASPVDLTAGQPASMRFFVDPTVVLFDEEFPAGTIPLINVFGKNSLNQLVYYSWNGSGWSRLNLSSSAIAGKVLGVTRDFQSLDIFARDSSNKLLHFYWSLAQTPNWQSENLTDYPNVGSSYVFANDPSVVKRGVTSLDLVMRNSSNHVIHYYYLPSTGWNAVNLNAERPGEAVANLIAGNPILVSRLNTVIDVFGRSPSNELTHHYGASLGTSDGALGQSTSVLKTNDGAGDVSCGIKMTRIGPSTAFSNTDGFIDTLSEQNTVMGVAGTVKVVPEINFCGALGSFSSCPHGAGTSMIVEPTTLTGILWAHQYGHIKGLPHAVATDRVMNQTLAADRLKVTSTECTTFKN